MIVLTSISDTLTMDDVTFVDLGKEMIKSNNLLFCDDIICCFDEAIVSSLMK